MELAMQIISNDKTVRSDTVQDLNILTLNPYQHKPRKENNCFQ